MTQIDIAALVADREAGTQGPWFPGGVAGGGRPTMVYSDDATGSAIADAVLQFVSRLQSECEANARRIARVPDMEAALIAQDAELKRLRRRMEMQSKYFLRDAKQALAGDPRALRNRVEMMEAEPLEIVLSDDARAALGEKP